MEKIVKNDGNGLVELLGLNKGSLKHQGNYYFTATNDEGALDIYTEPTDDINEYIRICRVFVDGHPYHFCDRCGKLVYEGEQRREVTRGYLCYTCQEELKKSGEQVEYDDWP